MMSNINKADAVTAFLRIAQQKQRSCALHGNLIQQLIGLIWMPQKVSKLSKAMEDFGSFVTTGR